MLIKICENEVSKKKYIHYCEKCDYSCSTDFLWRQHCSTKKHQRKKMLKNAQKNMQEHTCCCGKTYKHVQSYRRHLKICKKIKEEEKERKEQEEKDELRGMIKTLITQNQNMLMENNEMRKMVSDIIPKIGNTTINNKLNLQVFLTEHCKDAINLDDFINSLNINIKDLEHTMNNGLSDGIMHLFINGLKELGIHKRPIHCTDYKRETLYIKDNNVWDKEIAKHKIKKSFYDLADKQRKAISIWESANPDWDKSEKGKEEWIRLVQQVMNKIPDTIFNENKMIFKNIAKEVMIESNLKKFNNNNIMATKEDLKEKITGWITLRKKSKYYKKN